MRRAGLLAASALLGACRGVAPARGPADTAGDDRVWTCDASGGRQHWLLDSLSFVRATDGVSDGFDLDGAVSEAGGGTGCGIPDFTGPDGTPGVDNAFARLIPALENTEFIGAEALINDTIHSGELLLLTELTGVDDPVDDDCVGIALRRATGEPLVGTDGAFLAGQTLDLDPAFAGVEMDEMALVDGSVEGRPFSIDLPVQVLNASLEFRLRDGAIRADLLEDGRLSGVFAGGLSTADIMAVAQTENVNEEIARILGTALGLAADLAPDAEGTCTRVSLTAAFTATPVYIYDDVWD